MLIISKQHDYYDSIGKAAGVDKTVVYKRKERQYYSHHEEAKRFMRKTSRFPHGCRRRGKIKPGQLLDFSTGSVGFCGMTYPMLEVRRHQVDEDQNSFAETTWYYTTEAVKRLDGMMEELKFGASPWDNTSREVWLQFMFSMDDFHQFNSPILLVRGHTDSRDPVVIVDPVLRDIDFQKVVDPYSAFQEIQMFLSGVLGNTEKETVAISDVHRLEAAGFDKKWSFRKQSK